MNNIIKKCRQSYGDMKLSYKFTLVLLLTATVGLAIFIAGMLFVSLGIHRQEHKIVSKKSNIICLECIGIG